MFGKKGQSALEYLMTYGWALVVIVIVIAALVILVGSPGTSDSCTGSTKFTVPSMQDSATDLILVMTNATGQAINNPIIFTLQGYDTNTSATNISDPWRAGVTDDDVTFSGLWTAKSGTYSVVLEISYDDQYNNPHKETITCSGTV